MLKNVQEVSLVEALRYFVSVQVLEKSQDGCQAGVRYVSHRVFEGPNYGVHDEFELIRGDLEKSAEAVLVY